VLLGGYHSTIQEWCLWNYREQQKMCLWVRIQSACSTLRRVNGNDICRYDQRVEIFGAKGSLIGNNKASNTLLHISQHGMCAGNIHTLTTLAGDRHRYTYYCRYTLLFLYGSLCRGICKCNGGFCEQYPQLKVRVVQRQISLHTRLTSAASVLEVSTCPPMGQMESRRCLPASPHSRVRA
jgi:hypothetical protein